jgi:regulator of RNase E activity RraA
MGTPFSFIVVQRLIAGDLVFGDADGIVALHGPRPQQ